MCIKIHSKNLRLDSAIPLPCYLLGSQHVLRSDPLVELFCSEDVQFDGSVLQVSSLFVGSLRN